MTFLKLLLVVCNNWKQLAVPRRLSDRIRLSERPGCGIHRAADRNQTFFHSNYEVTEFGTRF
jgi:hypothetical protein